MKTERFSFKNKGEIFDSAASMHDCSFTATYENETLTVTFDHLEQYYGPYSDTPWFGDFKKLTIKYFGVSYLDLNLKYRKKEQDYYNTLSPLDGKELIMFGYAIDSFEAMRLQFRVYYIRKRGWSGTIEISPTDIEYIWE